MPPGPVSVTSRLPSTVSIRTTAASSASRPSRGVSGDGSATIVFAVVASGGSGIRPGADSDSGSDADAWRRSAAPNRSASTLARSAMTRSASSSASENTTYEASSSSRIRASSASSRSCRCSLRFR